ncbi:universal stress protein [Streptomyces actuosus]|uniref:universal stress protein n=1 Tax=Streptomyces actuosus TaxID=1885 RepID=UPI0027DAA5E4|nr:universal stress protein [Streptomyces actuosus]
METSSKGVILAGIDDTPNSWLAADWAATEAELRGSALRLVHAVGPGPEIGYDETGADLTRQVFETVTGMLDESRARIGASHPSLSIDAFVAHDRPAEAILDAAEDADLIVVGTRGRGGFAGLLLGSVSRRVAAHADRPVVVVREPRRNAADDGIVLGVRDDRDEEAARFAFAMAARRRTSVRLVHAWSPVTQVELAVRHVDALDEQQRAHRAVLNRVARPTADFPQVPVETELVRDSPTAALVAASKRAALVVVPRHPAEGRLGLHLGTVTHAVLHHAECSVAIVPTG